MSRAVRRSHTFLRIGAVFALIALGLMMWPLFDPSPIAVVVAMSLGQVFGTLSFLSFLLVVVIDVVRSRLLGSDRFGILDRLGARDSLPPGGSGPAPPPRPSEEEDRGKGDGP